MSGGGELGVRLRVEGNVGRISLDRPEALNALTLPMIEAMDRQLRIWADNPSVVMIMIEGAGGKAFCAGGDIAWLYAQMRSGDLDEARRFFRCEYRLNQLIATYPKPYVSLMHGIVIGGGVGVSAHGSHRIVTEKTLLVLPECSIGLIPDVGTSCLLGRAPGYLGEYIGLTGLRLNGADAIAARFADFFVPSSGLADLSSALIAEPTLPTIKRFAQAPEASQLTQIGAEIDTIFNIHGGGRAEGIERGLAASSADWAPAALRAIRQASPLSIHCALVAIRHGRRFNLVWKALTVEYRFVYRALAQGDFAEGIRAAVIDKDRKPKWVHVSFDDVTDADIEAMFISLGEHELSSRERT